MSAVFELHQMGSCCARHPNRALLLPFEDANTKEYGNLDLDSMIGAKELGSDTVLNFKH